jgi:predicted ATPase/GAF domain-containing protein/HPt (histidine-containing phosphotransfer) domain-containing protein
MKLPGYRLGSELGHDEHTSVYRAVREHDGVPVIVKTLSREYPLPAEVRRLEFEYRMLEKLRGAHVVTALGLARTGGQLALILEDFGANLLSARATPLPLSEFFRVAKQLVAALGHVHAHDVIHKDVRPHAVLANADGSVVKLLSFQLASEISREARDVSVQNRLEGALPYISPEQTGRMNRDLDYRSDHYSLGVTLFELLTGGLPFSASDVMGWVHCHISMPAPSVRERAPEVPFMLCELVAKLLAKEPRERYQSTRGLLADLERCEALARAGRGDERFPLGADDISERFALSQRLVGREDEVRLLTSVFEDACKGPGKLLLVSGYSGIGKSSLIRELHKPLAARRGYFAAGKFDQLDRSVPYAALMEALRNLVRQLLTEPDTQIADWRSRLLASLGAGASVMAELVPELTGVMGPQPAPPPLDPGSAQNRFKRVFARFIQTVASAAHPLVLFIDDLQWADASTPELLADLFIDHQMQHLLVIGAYRDNEVASGHLLSLALRRLHESAPLSVLELPLEPLGERGVTEMVAGALKRRPDECAPLAREIFAKTEGNPFFTSELLSTLYRQGAISFSAREGRWAWDVEAARSLGASQNVVELLLARLERLPDEALGALTMAACIGNVFSLSTLSSLLDRSPDSAASLLHQPLTDCLIVPLDDNYKLMQFDASDKLLPTSLEVHYRFQHDRVQQAAYSLIADEDKAARHLRIGRRLLARERDPEHPEDIFSVTNHLNVGRTLMTSVAEREALAKLNRRAGAKALAATAFAVAARYHEAGACALSSDEWAERPELRFALFSERVGSVLMAGERVRAAALCEDLFALAPTKAAHAAVHLIESQVMMHQGQMLQAVAAVRDGLRLLGIDYPEDPAAIDQAIGVGIASMQAHLARVPIDELVHLPEVTDAEKLVALQLLFHVVAPAIMTYPPLFILAELITFDLALTHGTTAVCAKNFVDVGMIQGAALGDYAAAYRLGKVAFRVVERYDARALAGQVHFVFAAYVSPWGAPYAEAVASFEEGRRLDIETGDHQHLAFNETLHLRMLLQLGRHLDECDAAAQAAATLLDRIHATVQVNGIRLCQHAIDELRGLDGERRRASTEQLTHDILASGNAQYAFQHGQVEMLVNVLLGDWDAAERWWEFTSRWQMAASTLLTVPEYHLLQVLVSAHRRWPRASENERPQLLAEMEKNVRLLEGWRELCPENFAHKHLLAAAELARVKGEQPGLVVALYDEAIGATESQFLHLRALASELFGQFLRGLGRARLAEPMLRDALQLYAQWGSLAKVRRLEAQIDGWFPRSRGAPAPSLEGSARREPGAPAAGVHRNALDRDALDRNALDLGSVLKANRAISGEVKTERLFAALMSAILENAAAQHGCLVLCEDDQQLYVRARADQHTSDRDVSVRHPLDAERRACHQIVRFVARSQEVLVIDDASAHPIFASDAYVLEHGVKSVLCMPIVNLGRLVAVLYVENGATTHAFTRDRVETLRLIAGQAAVSITNASLYEGLERKVEERTRELAAKSRKVAAMLDGIRQGVFTLDAELKVQPEYSRHLEQLVGRRDLVGRGLDEVLFGGSELDAATLDANDAALRFSIGAPPAIARLNAEHLIKAFSRRAADGSLRHYEVDWNWIFGEDGTVERVLVAARDVTLLRGLEEAAETATHEMDLLQQILNAGVDDFKSFCETSLRLVDRHLAAAARGIDEAGRRALFRDVHTIKGHSRTLGLDQIVAAAHAAERGCEAGFANGTGAPSGSARPVPGAESLAALRELARVLRDYEQTGERKLGRSWSGADARFKQALGAIESALAHAPERPSYPVRTLTQVKQVVHRLNAIPLDQVLRETARVFPSLARELGKSVPELEWVDDGTLLDADWGRLLKDALMHTFRNSLDHGIETSEERQALGKAPRGKIALRTERDVHGVRIRLRDDGRGLPIAELRHKTGRADSPDHDVAEAIFDYGISTARQLSTVSGRGIGMDAVRGFLRERGGDVVIEFTGDARSGYRPFELVFRLPSDAMIAP